MVRIGPYVAHDISPRSGASARQITEAGLEAKFAPPLLQPPWRAWALLGVGYARTYAPSYTTPAGFVGGAGGGILDIPAGVGLGYRVSRSWDLTVELAGHFGVAFAGSLYDDRQPGCLCAAEPFAGKDSVALSLSVGLSLNE